MRSAIVYGALIAILIAMLIEGFTWFRTPVSYGFGHGSGSGVSTKIAVVCEPR